jgi:hypothetical protein
MKNKIEGLKFNIGDRVKFSTSWGRCSNETTVAYLKNLYYWAFDCSPKNVDPNTTFKVERIKIGMDSVNGGIGAKISNGKKVSTWLTIEYLKKA